MKKHILFITIGMMCCAGAMEAINTTDKLNPFAYNLVATSSADKSTLTVKYCLNADVESLNIVISKDGNDVKRIEITESSKLKKTVADDPYLTSAQHSVNVPISDLGNGEFAWRIEVKGVGRNVVERYNQVYSFYLPSSVDIVKDPTSFNYGKVIVVEGSHSGLNNASYHSSSTGAGLYVFNPDFTYRKNRQGDPGFNGGSATWGDISNKYFVDTKYAPRRVRVSEDGRIFVSSMYEQGSTLHTYQKGIVLWEVDAYFSKWNTVMGHGVGGAKYDISSIYADKKYYYKNQLLTSGGDFIAAPNAGLDVRGRGENLKLLLLSCDYRAFAGNHQGFMCCEYNLGTNTTWSTIPSKDFVVNNHVFVASTNSNVQYDKDGGIWCISNRDQATDERPALVHKTSSVTEDYRNTDRHQSRNAGFRFNGDFTKVIMATTGQKGRVYDYYSVKQNGNYFSAALTEIDMSAVGTYINDFAWDNANNIYAVGNNGGVTSGGSGHIALYCMPYDANDVFTTPGPKTFTLTETICWHPYPEGYQVTNEDLWETFQADYNDWYRFHPEAENKITEKRAHQPITSAYGFTFPGDVKTNSDGQYLDKNGNIVANKEQAEKIHPDGLVSDFLTDEVSKWKWLGDYITLIANPTSVPKSNEALWGTNTNAGYPTDGFMYYYNDFYINTLKLNNFTKKQRQDITNVAGFTYNNSTIGGKLKDFMTDSRSPFKWLGDYIISVVGTSKDDELWWRAVTHSFFNKLSTYTLGTLTVSYNFTEAGKPDSWQPYYISPEGKNQIDTEMEWRKEVHAFFNQAKTCTYKNTTGETVTDNTGDYTTAGQPAQWYDEWWNATFKLTMKAYPTDSLPTIRRKGYVLSGWYYGDDDGYSLNDREATKGITRGGCCLWARWLETCLHEGYITGNSDNSAANEEMGQQINRNIEFINVMQGKSDYQMKIDRKLQSGAYNTFVIPFALSKREGAYNYIGKIVDAQSKPLLTGNTSVLCFQGSSIIENGTGEYVLQLNFERWEDTDNEYIAANRPILIMPENDITEPMHTTWPPYISSAAFKPLEDDPYVEFIPVLAPSEVQGGAGTNNLILVADNRLARLSSTGTMLGLRAYFNGNQIPNNLSLKQMIVKITEKNGVVTYLDNIETPQQGATAIKILQNGTIYILRDGKVYDIMGRSLREL